MGDLVLIAGLGNPGREYERTRHNIGFMVVDEIARRLGLDDWRKKSGAATLAAISSDLVLTKPLEFMNDSGPPLQATARFYRIPPSRMLVISDDLDLPFGRLRMRTNGGHGGHNGLRSIIAVLGEGFPRLRVGIGRGRRSGEGAVIDRVLGPFSSDEQAELSAVVAAAAEGALLWHGKDVDAAMRFVNTWQTPPANAANG